MAEQISDEVGVDSPATVQRLRKWLAESLGVTETQFFRACEISTRNDANFCN